MFVNLLISGSCLILGISCYTLQTNVTTYFPSQKALAGDPYKFVRTDTKTNVSQVISCPNGSKFHPKLLKCVFVERKVCTSVVLPSMNVDHCKTSATKTVPDQLNCRSFFMCQGGHGIWAVCNSPFLYDKRAEYCRSPLEVDCCEYPVDESTTNGKPSNASSLALSKLLVYFCVLIYIFSIIFYS